MAKRLKATLRIGKQSRSIVLGAFSFGNFSGQQPEAYLEFAGLGFRIPLGQQRLCVMCNKPIGMWSAGLTIRLRCWCSEWEGGSANYGSCTSDMKRTGPRDPASLAGELLRQLPSGLDAEVVRSMVADLEKRLVSE